MMKISVLLVLCVVFVGVARADMGSLPLAKVQPYMSFSLPDGYGEKYVRDGISIGYEFKNPDDPHAPILKVSLYYSIALEMADTKGRDEGVMEVPIPLDDKMTLRWAGDREVEWEPAAKVWFPDGYSGYVASIPAGEIHVGFPGAALYLVLEVYADSADGVQEGLKLFKGLVFPPDGTAKMVAALNEHRHKFPGIDQPPHLLFAVEPRSPKDEQGKLILSDVATDYLVELDGSVGSIHFRGTSNPVLQKAVLDALSVWRFVPLTSHGKPTTFKLNQVFDFEVH